MALVEVKVPQLSESVAEATLLQWHKQAGEAVGRDENLIDIETDKVVLELPAPESGVITEIRAGDGATVVADQVIAIIDTEAKAGAAAAQASAPAASEPAAAPAPAQQAPGSQSAPAPASRPGKEIAMPSAAKLMAENNLGSGDVAGTGKGGRITKGDVLGALSAPTPAPAPAVPIPSGTPAPTLPQVRAPIDLTKVLEGRPEQRVPMSRLRQRVAERLLQSQATNAILTTFNEINMAPVKALRQKHQE